MRDFRNAKAMAKSLRAALAARSLQVTHSESLELIAQALGEKNWQTLSAAIESAEGGVQKTSSPAPQAAKSALPLIPMRDFVVFPEMAVPLFAGRRRTLAAIESAMAGDRRLFLVTQRRREVDSPSAQDLFDVGVQAVILQSVTLADRTMKLVVQGERRARLVKFTKGEFLEAEVETLHAPANELDKALAQEALERFSRFANFDLASPPIALAPFAAMTAYPAILADLMSPHVAIGVGQAQALLEIVEPAARLTRLLDLMAAAKKAA